MNTGKQINAMVVVLFLTLIAVGVYAIWDPFRASSAETDQLDLAVERAAITFTQNCRLCHGDAGQGGAGKSGRLAAAAQLDRSELRGIEAGAFSVAAFDGKFKLVSDTITCGRVGTQMPTWGASQGGTLNTEQIRQLAILITGGDPGYKIYHEEGFWTLVQEHADKVDATTTRHATLEMPSGSLGPDETVIVVSDAGRFNLGQYVRIKNGEEGEERMRILPNALRVQRGAAGTGAAKHEVGAAVLDENGAPILDTSGENEQALIEAMDNQATLVVVADTDVFESGDVLQIDGERVQVTEVVTGLPTTHQRVVREIGREPKHILISGGGGITAGMTVRIGSELMEVVDVSDQGDPHAVLASVAGAGDGLVAVSDPAFFGEDYVFRASDELIRVIGPVDTKQELAETIGRAQTSFTISGADGIEQGMVIRMDSELMRVAELLEPARIEIDRGAPLEEGAEATTAAAHAAGTQIFSVTPPAKKGDEPAYEATDVVLLEDASLDDPSFVLNTVGHLSAGETYRIDDELIKITDVSPARIRVERAVDGTERAAHGRRIAIYGGNLLEVERGFDNTTAAAHDEGEKVFMTELQVKRRQQDSLLEDHAKNAEIFLGNSLIVERGQKDTEPAPHENGQLVRDFPTAPDGPPTVQQACGQSAAQFGGGPTTRPTPVAGSKEVDISLHEFAVDTTPATIADGLTNFIIENTGSGPHNFRVIQTELPADGLPLSGDTVDETAVNVVASSDTVTAGTFASVITTLDPGRYVLICNVPTHYGNGMRTEFQVTAP